MRARGAGEPARLGGTFHRRQHGVELTVEDGPDGCLLEKPDRGELDFALVGSTCPLPDAFRSDAPAPHPHPPRVCVTFRVHDPG